MRRERYDRHAFSQRILAGRRGYDCLNAASETPLAFLAGNSSSGCSSGVAQPVRLCLSAKVCLRLDAREVLYGWQESEKMPTGWCDFEGAVSHCREASSLTEIVETMMRGQAAFLTIFPQISSRTHGATTHAVDNGSHDAEVAVLLPHHHSMGEHTEQAGKKFVKGDCKDLLTCQLVVIDSCGLQLHLAPVAAEVPLEVPFTWNRHRDCSVAFEDSHRDHGVCSERRELHARRLCPVVRPTSRSCVQMVWQAC